jgi:putative phosphoribosyl transferase
MTLHSAAVTSWPVHIVADGNSLNGDLSIPQRPLGLVMFAHGSGSGRHSARNRSVAETLQQGHMATLLMDLLTESEERTDAVTAEFRFDIALLARRVVSTIDWVRLQPQIATLPIGLFGASTGAAAALIAAAERPDGVRAVVSRGGRPDLADEALDRVVAPTLLIVGGRDEVVIDLNRDALARLRGAKEMVLVPGATHLFEEPGTLERVAQLATDWFASHLTP